MNTKKIKITELTNEQLSWMIAKHVYPKDAAVLDPLLAVGGYHYDFAEPEPECETCRLIDKHKISTLWRPWLGECGQWWACCEQDPSDEETMGFLGDTRTQAAMRALLATLEAAGNGGDDVDGVEVPEVLL